FTGGSSRVELRVHNRSRHRSPVLMAADRFDGGKSPPARFVISSLERSGQATVGYRVIARRRGVHTIGPLQVELRDPFGLASRSATTAASHSLVVYPNIDEIPALPGALGGDPSTGPDHPSYLGRLGENHSALRTYEDGDDLRRVHWPSTARTGQLMIRQEEMPWDGRTTVLLDVRRPVHDEATLERAVGAAASITAASLRQHNSVRLVTTDAVDTGFGISAGHRRVILERLAQARWSSTGSLVTALSGVGARSATGALVVVTTSGVVGVDLNRITALSDTFPVLVIVTIEKASARRAPHLPGHITSIQVPERQPFATAWGSALPRRSRRRP
ncbi:MAG: DUF58 domain-containing protein, partial [Acidimicrobiales bacterium]